jgi:putative ABC transport system permease protein
VLLFLFPTRFRHAHASDVIGLFRDRYREAYRRFGTGGVVFFLARAVVDAIVHGAIERWCESRTETTGAPVRSSQAGRGSALGHDLRYALRSLRKSPGFTAVAILTLAIGIGANTAIFSVVNGVLLHPLPYENPEDLVAIYTYWKPESGREDPKYAVGSPEYFDYLDQQKSMESVAAVSTELLTIVEGDGDPEYVIAGYVSSSMFSVLKTPPLIGRTLVAEDDGAEPQPVFVLGYGLWQRRFGGDPGVVGQTLDIGLDRETGTQGLIVGVMPEGFAFPTPETELWTQLALDPARTWRGGHWFHMIARLAAGVTFEQAEAEMKSLMVTWTTVIPEHHTGHGLFVVPLLEDYVGDVRPALLMLLGAVGFVLLIACANVANLLSARGEGRRREMAVRNVLGAGRGRLVQQLLTESLILSALGGACGVVLAYLGIDLLLALKGGSLPRLELIGLDLRVLCFTLGVVLLTSLAFGLMPALQAAPRQLSHAIKAGSRTTTPGRERKIFRRSLIVTEVALALLLVIGAGLLTKSFRELLQVDLGIRTENLLIARISLPASDYTGAEAVLFYTRLREVLEALPGAESAAVISRPPLLTDRSSGRFHIEDRPDLTPGNTGFKASHMMVGEAAFETLGIRLQRGRLLNQTDRADGQLSVVIDEQMARIYWPGEDPIGQKIRFGRTDGPWHAIVGIVDNVKIDGLHIECPSFYHYHQQTATWGDHFARTMYVVVRTENKPTILADPLRETVRSLDSGLPITSISTMNDIVSRALARPRFLMTLLVVFAIVALILGAVGVYGVMSHGVMRRTNEIGIRIAFGARTSEIAGMVLREGVLLSMLGVSVGLAAAWATTRVLSGMLFQVSPTDPWTYMLVSMIMILVALSAAYLPARRATKVDPFVALRDE